MWFLLGKEFARQGHEVVHVSRLYEGIPEHEIIEGVRHGRVKGYDTPGNLLFLKLQDLRYTLSAIRRLPEADILVSNTFWLPALVRNERFGAMLVDVQRMPKGQIKLYRRAACLRANSTAVEKAILADDPKAAGRTVMIPNPLTFLPDREIKWEDKDKIILYAGRLHPEKGIELLLKAFAIFQKSAIERWKLRLVGPYEVKQGGGGREWRENLIRQYNHMDGIEWVEPIFDQNKLNEEYEKAKVFVYPSLAEKGETFGLASLEAMAWGCIPVASDLDCFKDFIRHEENGYIFDHRNGDASSALAQALANPITEDLSKRCLKVRKTHAVSRIALMFLKEFSSLLKS